MAIIRCKMCGGELTLSEGQSVAECEYCGSMQTVPKADDEKKLNLFARANRLRAACDFDKAAGIYEAITADFPEEPEAYWGLVLCRYGIEYVDDPATGKKIPTCHRSSFDSVLKDPNVELAQEYADVTARRLYRQEIRQIEELRKGIIQVSANEAPYDIFICYKETGFDGKRTLDSVLAQDIYDALTEKGYRVFFSRISLEDKLGTEYEPYIFAALNSARLMLVVGTDYEHFNAVWVKNEWSRFLKLMTQDRSRHLIPCYKGLDAYDMPEEFARLQAQDLDRMGAIQDIVRGVQKLLPRQEQPAKEPVAETEASPLLKRGQLALEDGEWQDADGFFEGALNQDAECAEAYIGKALCRERCRSLQALVEKWLDNSAEAGIERLSIPREEEHIRQTVQRCTVEGYLPCEEIEKLYDRTQRYSSTLASRQEQRGKGEQIWDSNRFLARAARFARGATAERLQAAKNAFLSALDDRVTQAEAEQTAAEEAGRTAYAEFLAGADAEVEKRFAEATRSRASDYEKCAAIVEKSEFAGELYQAEKLLVNMGDRELLGRCRERTAELRERQRQEAAEAEQRRKEQERATRLAYMAKRRRERKMRTVIACVIVGCLLFLLLLVKVVIPQSRYDKAGALFDEGKYMEAAELYEQLGDYEDSAEKHKLSSYRHACQLMEAGEYEKARVGFQELALYSDSSLRIKECTYQIGLRFFEEGKYETALTAFTELEDYRDSVEWVRQTKDAMAAISYQSAEEALAKGDIFLAAAHFGDAGGYKDAWERCLAIWDPYTVHNTLCAEGYAVYALRENGTVVTKYDKFGCLSTSEAEAVEQWTGIVAIANTDDGFAALREDGTVLLEGNDGMKEITDQWTGIVAIGSSGYEDLYGLRYDGTVISTDSEEVLEENVTRLISGGGGIGMELRDGSRVFYNMYGTKQDLEAKGWTDVEVFCGSLSGDVALLSDGTVLAEYDPSSDYAANLTGARNWEDIIAISADSLHLLGLKADGTVVAVGDGSNNRVNVSRWTDIVAVETGLFISVGLKSDGTVVSTADGELWTDIRLPG